MGKQLHVFASWDVSMLVGTIGRLGLASMFQRGLGISGPNLGYKKEEAKAAIHALE